jgi:hypothetical protein
MIHGPLHMNEVIQDEDMTARLVLSLILRFTPQNWQGFYTGNGKKIRHLHSY